jgi:hypothetical protein
MPAETEAQIAGSYELPGESVFPQSAAAGAEAGNACMGSRARRWPWFAGRLVACAATFAALVVAGCGGLAGPVEPRHPPRCSSMLFVGVRGSGEDPSRQLAMGTTVYPVYAGVRSADPQVAGYGWAYRGERPGLTELRHAAAALDGFLDARARRCPAGRIILVGYSAGALVVGDALQSPALTAAACGRVAAAVMLADPEFNPAARATAAGTFDPRYGGTPRRRFRRAAGQPHPQLLPPPRHRLPAPRPGSRQEPARQLRTSANRPGHQLHRANGRSAPSQILTGWPAHAVTRRDRRP